MRLIKSLHKWLSVLVAIQLFIWLSSCLFFNLMDHDKARGNKYRVNVKEAIPIDFNRLLEPKTLLRQQVLAVNSIKLITLLSKPYYLLSYKQALYPHFYHEHALINAYTGEQKIIDNDMAQTLASHTYNGSGAIKFSAIVTPPIDDFPKEQNTLWHISYADELNTSIYIDASSGRLVGHSNDNKRFADFFFMLHFMDYGSVGGFNNWQIIFFALLTLLFSMTGFIWTVELWVKGRYKIR